MTQRAFAHRRIFATVRWNELDGDVYAEPAGNRDGVGEGNLKKFSTDPHWRDLVLFHEYFHGDSGSGIGTSHQTGWTGLVTKLMQQGGELRSWEYEQGLRP